ncbi:MAG TPA: HNH endonuclease [Bacteroidia bacterium]|nr:HNH endonuclease [Bacteroidia bacterium]HRH08781.1 HNH endonuclease [Bacteroidia bacterium]
MKYSEKLNSPLWQRKRLEIFSRDNFSCTECGSNHKTLHVHHKKYSKGADPWEYKNQDLTTLCFECHEKEHVVILDPERKYEHLILWQETPIVINTLNMQLHQLQNKLKENIPSELMNEILKNIMFIQQQKRELLQEIKN